MNQSEEESKIPPNNVCSHARIRSYTHRGSTKCREKSCTSVESSPPPKHNKRQKTAVPVQQRRQTTTRGRAGPGRAGPSSTSCYRSSYTVPLTTHDTPCVIPGTPTLDRWTDRLALLQLGNLLRRRLVGDDHGVAKTSSCYRWRRPANDENRFLTATHVRSKERATTHYRYSAVIWFSKDEN